MDLTLVLSVIGHAREPEILNTNQWYLNQGGVNADT